MKPIMESPSPPPPPSSSLRALTSLLLCSLFPPPPSSDDCRISVQSRRVLLRDFAAREFNAFLWVFLIAVTALLLARLLKLVRLWRSGGRIAGPPCTSFYSHFELLSRGSLAEVLSDSHKNYGSVVKLWLGPTRLLVSIKDPKLIKEMIFKAADKLPLTGKAFNRAFGRSSFFASSFREVQKGRETLTTDFLERRNVIPEKVFECIVERIQRSMAEGSVDCKTLSQHMAFTIMGTTLFGGDFLALSNANIYENLLMKISEEASFWASYNITPVWKMGFWRYRRLCADLKCLTGLIIEQCREKCYLCHSLDHGRTKTKGCLDDIKEKESFGNIIGLMFHGCQTTTVLIDNILMRLVQHPKLQDEIYDEISTALRGSTAPVEQSIVDKMPLLLATVYEASRLLPAGPLLQRCSPKHDLCLEDGVVIPAEAAIVVPVHLMNKDYSSWGSDTFEFNPYRFLSHTKTKPDLALNTSLTEEATDLEDNSFVLNDPKDHDAYLTFGSGVRSCVGQRFAIQGVAGLFATLLKHYKISLLSEAENSQTPKVNECLVKVLSSMKLDFLRRTN